MSDISDRTSPKHLGDAALRPPGEGVGDPTEARDGHDRGVGIGFDGPSSSHAPGVVKFFVPGVPQPGGSKRAFRTTQGRLVVTDANPRARPWRAVVQVAAHAVHSGAPLTGPLRLTVTFTLPRPRGHFGRRGLRPAAPRYPTTRPDATKLLRALEDACTGLLWRDDAQIVEQVVAKGYGEPPGAAVRVEALAS